MEASDGIDEISKMLSFVPQVRELFNVKEKVGEGTFSKVFRAEVKGGAVGCQKEYALKYLVPTSRPSRIASELQYLKEVGGTCNIVGVELCIMHRGHVVIVMPYFPHQRFVEYVKFLSVDEIRDYMKNLFIALDKAHAHGIIHRDVKPNNFLYDRYNRRYALVDFGLAQRMENDHRFIAANTQPFKDHNALLMQERLNKSEPALADTNEIQDKASRQLKQPSQSTPVLPLRKRLQTSDQENGNPSKKALFGRYKNEGNQSVSSVKASILPTPPHTPNRSVINLSRIQRNNHCQPSASKKLQNDANKAKSCNCYGKDVVCKLCISREVEEAPRGGTPGFRAPEVLLKHRQQSTAIDMWSAGVILLSILSKKYPFFRAEDDLTALAEIVFIVGLKEMKEAALKLGKSIVLNLPKFSEEVTEIRKQMCPARYLQALCAMFCREENESATDTRTSFNSVHSRQTSVVISDSVYDLLNRLLDPNPSTRITASEALCHPFIIGC